MSNSPLRRALALFLCAQPFLWMSDVARAQSLEERARAAAGLGGGSPSTSVAVPGPVAPGDTEIVRPERHALSAAQDVPVVDEPLDPDQYVCGPGDVLELNFWGIQNFKLRITVDMEGRAFVPKVGYFALAGKTLSDARRLMRAQVASYFPQLRFDATLAEPRTFVVQIAEAVDHPGAYRMRAIDRLSSVIAKAGGFAGHGSRRRVEIRRRDGTTLHADLLRYALTGDLKHDPHLLDGDVVRVPYEGLAATIGGAVRRPGRYELVDSKDLAELLELAGGLSPAATRQLPLRVVRRAPDDRHDQTLLDQGPGGALPALALEHDDQVTIPSYSELQQSVMVVGAIGGAGGEEGATRRLPFVHGDSVRTLLERAGGVGPHADFQGAYVLRGGRSLPVDLYALLMLRDVSADRPVELGDTVVVPSKRRAVVVEGAVFKPGPQPYNPTFGVQQYLSLAGGPNRFALPITDVRLVTPDGRMTEYRPDLTVPPGSSLVVPERNFSRSELVQIGLGVAGILVSGVAVVLAARR